MSRRSTYLSLALLCLLLSFSTKGSAQTKPHSAKKAGIMSACLPGLGQIYNGKWWKTPIVYAGFGGIGYLAYSNYSDYRLYLTAYEISTGDLPEDVTPSEEAIQLSQRYLPSQLQTYKEDYRRSFELSCIALAAWYGLNIVDAIVDGHFYSYDISDDLSFQVDPMRPIPSTGTFRPMIPPAGLTLSLNF